MEQHAEAPGASAEGRFRALVEDLPAVTYIADFVGAFTLRYLSPQLQSIFGYAPEAWISDPDAWVRALHPDDRDRIVAEAESCIAAERPFDFEYRLVTAAGDIAWVWEKTAIVRDDAGRPIAVNGVMLDVTELKRTQQALLHEADRRIAERTRFEATLRRQADEHLHRALHDELTGLPNRRCLFARLTEQLDRDPDESFALMLVDLDRFKEVNDVLGHDSGDQLLRQVAARFAAAVREDDLLARLGGDEFAVMVIGRDPGEAGLEIARRLSSSLDREFVIGGAPIHTDASIGIARYPQDGRDAVALLRCADAAMYAAKELSTELELFDASRDGERHSPGRLQRLGELRRAISRDELILHYQPKLDLATGRVVGVEALVRWDHPRHGLLPPMEFIPLAEQTGLIKPLTGWVLATALSSLARLAGPRARPCDLGQRLGALAARRRVRRRGRRDAARLRGRAPAPGLEITEGTVMADPERAAVTLRRLSELGVRVSIDDFGAGYSSLGRLRSLPIDEIKIDRSFATGIEGDAQHRAIMRTADRAGAQPRVLGRRRGPGDGRRAGVRRRARLRRRSGLPHRPAARGRRPGRLARGRRPRRRRPGRLT